LFWTLVIWILGLFRIPGGLAQQGLTLFQFWRR